MFVSITSVATSPLQSYIVNVTPIDLTISGLFSSFVFMVGIAATGEYGRHWSWRSMTVITGAFVILLDGVTTFITLGDAFRSQWFWLGLPIASQLPYGVNFLNGAFVIVEIAGEGHEGAMYGLLTTVSNLSAPFASTLTKIIDSAWDLSNERITRDTTDVRWDITYSLIIMYACSAISWLFLFFLPRQKEETQELKRNGGSRFRHSRIYLVRVRLVHHDQPHDHLRQHVVPCHCWW